MTLTFAATYYETLQSRGDTPFWITPNGSKSYADLVAQVRMWAGAFDTLKLQTGDKVMIAAKDDWLTATLFIAAVLDNKVPLVLSPEAGAPRLAAIGEQVQPKMKLDDAENAGQNWTYGATLCTTSDTPANVADYNALQTELDRVMAQSTPRDPICTSSEDDTAYLLFTSGTTQAPKGAILSHKNLAQQLTDITRVFELSPDARLFNGLVFYHTDGLIQGPVLCGFAGCALVRPAAFAIERLEADLTFLEETGSTHMISVPLVYKTILTHAPRDDYFRRPEFHAILSTAARLEQDDWEGLERRFGVPVINEYGMTETVAACLFAGPHPEMGEKFTIGKPVGCVVSIRDEQGQNVGSGAQGELWVKGPIVFQGYFQDADRTAAVLQNGWLKTGDLVQQLEDGSIRIVGRLNTTINSGGFCILPEEIDEALLRHQDVEDAYTVGLDHPEFGTIPVSAIVASGAADTDLYAHCRDTLEPWKQPRKIVKVDILPRTGSGKADIERIKELLIDKLEITLDPTTEVEAGILKLAALVFNVDEDQLELDHGPDEIPGWDSFTHMTLAVEAEKKFEIKLKSTEVLELETLGDLMEIVLSRVEN